MGTQRGSFIKEMVFELSFEGRGNWSDMEEEREGHSSLSLVFSFPFKLISFCGSVSTVINVMIVPSMNKSVQLSLCFPIHDTVMFFILGIISYSLIYQSLNTII